MIRRKFLKALLPVFLVATGTVPAATAFAQGDSPSTATAVSADWTALPVGGRAWYSFEYAGDGSQILVRMGNTPAGSAQFSIWTPQNLADWAQGAGEKPVGRGSANSLYGGDQVWAGSFNTAGTYYVVVDSLGTGPSQYNLQITGGGVHLTATR
ncbi:MAG: hypothetical protein ACYC5O_04110 [Anaerolineae bacterium]